jgi:hypothetical protein
MKINLDIDEVTLRFVSSFYYDRSYRRWAGKSELPPGSWFSKGLARSADHLDFCKSFTSALEEPGQLITQIFASHSHQLWTSQSSVSQT